MSFGKINVYGYGSLKARLTNIAVQVPQHAARSMRGSAEQIVTLSKLQCPHDKGALEESIHQEVMTDEGSRRLVIDIVAGGSVDGVDVDQYAVQIHENYESMKPGPHTLAKMAANPGVVIGSKFIARAVDSSEERMTKSMIEAIVQVVEK